jgi:hypothetical protein
MIFSFCWFFIDLYPNILKNTPAVVPLGFGNLFFGDYHKNCLAAVKVSVSGRSIAG